MTIIGGLEPGTLEYTCECGRSLGYARKDGKGKTVKCKCGRHMLICEMQIKVKPRKMFVMSSGG